MDLLGASTVQTVDLYTTKMVFLTSLKSRKSGSDGKDNSRLRFWPWKVSDTFSSFSASRWRSSISPSDLVGARCPISDMTLILLRDLKGKPGRPCWAGPNFETPTFPGIKQVGSIGRFERELPHKNRVSLLIH